MSTGPGTPTAVVTSKPWWQSKTNWLGILTLAGSILGIVTKLVPVSAGVTGAAVGIINIVLRIWFTNVPIG